MNVTITAWGHRKESYNFSGIGKRVTLTVEELANALIEEAGRTVAKGEGTCFALGTSERGGSNDDECGVITGMLLDLDDRAFFSRVVEIEAALKALGLAYIISTRNQKAHVLLFFETPIAPPHDKPGEKAHKAARVRVLESLGADFGVEFDPSPAKRFLGLVYPYNKLPVSPAGATASELTSEIETRWQDGAGLDFGALLECLGEPTAAVKAPPVSGAAGDFFAAARANAAAPKGPNPDAFTPLSPGDTIGAIKARANRQNTNNPDMQKRVRLFLAGKSWATPKEQRDTTAQALTTWLALYTDGKGDIEAIMEVAGPSLDAMVAEQATGFGDDIETKFLAKLHRNMSQVRHNAAKQAAQLAGIASALTGRR